MAARAGLGGPVDVGSRHLAQIPPADLHIPVLGQPAPRSFRSALLSNRVRWRQSASTQRSGGPLGRGAVGVRAAVPLTTPPHDGPSLPFALTATQPRPGNGWGPSRPALCCRRAVRSSKNRARESRIRRPTGRAATAGTPTWCSDETPRAAPSAGDRHDERAGRSRAAKGDAWLSSVSADRAQPFLAAFRLSAIRGIGACVSRFSSWRS